MTKSNVSQSLYSDGEQHLLTILETLITRTITKRTPKSDILGQRSPITRITLYTLSFVARTSYTMILPLVKRMLEQGLIYVDGLTPRGHPTYNITSKGRHIYELFSKQKKLLDT